MASGAVAWWWVVPPGQVNDPTRPKSAVLISTTTGSALYNALNAGGQGFGTGTLNGQQVGAFQGPFPTEAEARAAPAAGGSALQQVLAGAGAGLNAAGQPVAAGAVDAGAAAAQNAGSTLNALGDVAAAMKAFYSAVTDGKMWRSVAWILLGLVLMVNGILLWLKIPQRAAGVAGAAARSGLI